MATIARFAVRASMTLVTLLIAVATFLAVKAAGVH